MFRLMREPDNRSAVVNADAKVAAALATIRGKTSPLRDD
jgi:hypothetical protein